jgi:hypothetical protein
MNWLDVISIEMECKAFLPGSLEASIPWRLPKCFIPLNLFCRPPSASYIKYHRNIRPLASAAAQWAIFNKFIGTDLGV